jgi:serine/threonine-protein kinase
MGEVYRAHDTRLGRDVAMKILPRAFTDDPDRLARFEREARVLAALNHPNIAIVHGVEESDGIRGLVMELIDGETLAERVARGPTPIDEALRIATQIANALEAAHEQGIIHRDLKPANIKVRADGTVKVLDFGLAKAMEPAKGSSPSMPQPVTITTSSMMQAGMILGTAAYMAPEQALGKPVDKRADIWAFGAVLFELLTGRRPFDGEDAAEVLGAVVRLEPQWDTLPPTVPARVSQTLRLCLRKDPKQRVGDIRDVRLALEGAFETGVSQVAEFPVVWRRALPVAGAALLTAIIVGFAAWSVQPSPAPRPVNRFQHLLPEGRDFTNTAPNTGRSVLALSPDGRRFVYAGTGGLYLRSMDTLEDQLISGSPPQSSNPTFSPDGTWLAFWSGGWLQKIAVVGGAPVLLTESPNPLGVRWDQDDTIIYSQSGRIRRVSADGGDPEWLGENAGALAPQLLPDGTTVLFESVNDGQIAVRARESDTPTILFAGQRPTYLSTGHLVYVQDGVLSAVPFDAGTLKVTGRAVPLTEGVQGSPPQYAVSASGSLVYVTNGLDTGTAARRLALVDRDGGVQPLDLPPGAYGHPRVSPDGRHVALQVAGADGSDIWVYDLSRATAFRRLTLEGNNTYPIWTPDGSRITYASDRDGRMSPYWQPADGSGVAERLTPPEEALAYLPEAWSPDGRTLALRLDSGGSSQQASLWTLSLDDGNAPRVFYDIADNQFGATFSADGKWLAYLSGAFGQAQVFVQPFPPTGEIRQVSTHEDSAWPVWSRKGTELFYRRTLSTGRYTIVAVAVTLNGGFTVGVAHPLPIEGFSTVPGIRNFDVMPDGQRFLMLFPANRTGDGAAVRPTITIVENWFEEVRRRVPTP